MAVHYRTQGFILKKNDRGEADRILVIYTKNFGKLETLAKAVRKIKSKLRAGLELFCLSEIEFIQGKTYKTLTDTILIDNFKNLKNDLEKLKTAFQLAEVFDNLVKGQEKDENLWDLLVEVFKKLDDCRAFSVSCSLIYYYFFWNFLFLLGYSPQLYTCLFCQRKLLPGTLYFSPKEGGIICNICFKKNKKSLISLSRITKIDPSVIKILRIILKGDWKIFSRLKINSNYQKSLKIISEDYLKNMIK